MEESVTSDHDFYAVIGRDCVASSDREAHETSLRIMAHKLRWKEGVTDSNRIIGIWSREAVVGEYNGGRIPADGQQQREGASTPV